MRLYEELFKNEDGFSFARCLISPAGGGYFEGVKSLGDFSSEKVEIYFKKETVVAEGENLFIKKYCDGDLQIDGKIYALYVKRGEEGGK
ncbi:MAG: YabP/YqfC family sporulation protein [Clostridia bacterium]|nr:YabP/YqfC family sporulation protein [Clostridia bacterium]